MPLPISGPPAGQWIGLLMLSRRHNSARWVCVTALCLSLLTGSAWAGIIDGAPRGSDTQAVQVRVTQPTPSVTSAGHLRAAVQVTLSAPAEYVEVRLRLKRSNGRTVYQKTEVRPNLQAGTNLIEFDHDLTALNLAQGRYPIEVRVLATGSLATTVNSRLLVTDPQTRALPVAVVVVASAMPAVTTDGHFIVDPAHDTRLRDSLSFVTEFASAERVPLSLAVPPVLIEQLGRIAAGYETTAGITVPASADVPVRAARLLDSLASAAASDTVSFVDVPYALPDLGRLQSIGASADLLQHWRRTDAVNASIMRSSGRPSVAYVGSSVTANALTTLAERGVSCVLVPPSAVASTEETASPGCYRVSGSATKLLVIDEEASRGALEGPEAFYDALFDRIGGGPTVLMFEVGNGDSSTTPAVQRTIEWIEEASWLRLAGLESLARSSDGEDATLAVPDRAAGDVEYWAEVSKGREAAVAYADAAGPEDADAIALTRAFLLSESSLFSRGTQPEPAHDGTSFSRDVQAFVSAQFGLIRLDSKDITLSGTKGEVPLTLINDTGKPLKLTLHARSSAVIGDSPEQEIDIQPTQNFLTVPIDLGNTLSDTLVVEIKAGDVTVTETVVEVRASYIDRLATIGMVVLVLGGLLLYIRRKVLASDAATIVRDESNHPRGE